MAYDDVIRGRCCQLLPRDITVYKVEPSLRALDLGLVNIEFGIVSKFIFFLTKKIVNCFKIVINNSRELKKTQRWVGRRFNNIKQILQADTYLILIHIAIFSTQNQNMPCSCVDLERGQGSGPPPPH